MYSASFEKTSLVIMSELSRSANSISVGIVRMSYFRIGFPKISTTVFSDFGVRLEIACS